VGGDLSRTRDVELLRNAASDPQAFAEFYRRYERLIAGWLVRRCGRAHLAADLTAEVFAEAYLCAGRFRDGPEPAAAWLLGIARHKLLRSLRSDRIEASALRRLGVQRVEVSEESLEALGALGGSELLDLLEALPEDQREAVRARVLDDSTYEELARRFQTSPATVRQRVSRGLASLRTTLQSGGDNS
jgi:RNA polymerase sigma factor (sigma-70 family)